MKTPEEIRAAAERAWVIYDGGEDEDRVAFIDAVTAEFAPLMAAIPAPGKPESLATVDAFIAGYSAAMDHFMAKIAGEDHPDPVDAYNDWKSKKDNG